MSSFPIIFRAVIVIAAVAVFGVAVFVVLGQFPQRYDIPLPNGGVFHNRHAYLFNTINGRCLLTAVIVFLVVPNAALAWHMWQNRRRKPRA